MGGRRTGQRVAKPAVGHVAGALENLSQRGTDAFGGGLAIGQRQESHQTHLVVGVTEDARRQDLLCVGDGGRKRQDGVPANTCRGMRERFPDRGRSVGIGILQQAKSGQRPDAVDGTDIEPDGVYRLILDQPDQLLGD